LSSPENYRLLSPTQCFGKTLPTLGDFTNIQGKTIPDILEAIPPNAKRRSFTPQSGKVQEGVEYKWVDDSGKKWMVEIHGPDASPQAMGGNASQGWVVRVRLNGKYLDHNGIPHPQGPILIVSIMILLQLIIHTFQFKHQSFHNCLLNNIIIIIE
jgi:hypothetical protein